jgi:GNAT superfamily N-acetyltransferase
MSLYEILFGVDKKQVRVKGKGECMFPLIRGGDEMVIEPRSLEDIFPGEIAAFRLNDRIAAHRVIGKTTVEGVPCLRTKGDNNNDQGEMVFEKDLVGVVVQVERKGKIFIPRKRRLSPLQRFFNTCWLRLHIFYSYSVRPFLITGWAGVRLFVLGCIGSRMMHREVPSPINVSFDIASQVKLPWLRIFHDVGALKEPAIVSRSFYGDWQVTFSHGEIVYGFFTFHRQKDVHPQAAFLTHLYINPRYWRTRTAFLLLRKLDAFCRLVGLERLYAAAKTRPARRFLRDLQFRPFEGEAEVLYGYFFEYLGPQALPRMFGTKSAKFILRHDVSTGQGRADDLALLGVE